LAGKEKKWHNINFRVDEVTQLKLKSLAKSSNMSLTDYILLKTMRIDEKVDQYNVIESVEYNLEFIKNSILGMKNYGEEIRYLKKVLYVQSKLIMLLLMDEKCREMKPKEAGDFVNKYYEDAFNEAEDFYKE
jgi:hypothetical protein